MSDPTNGRLVTYPALVSAVGGVVIVCGAIAGFVYAEHVSHAHLSAVTNERYTEGMETVNDRLGRIENKVDKLLDRGDL